MKKVGLIGVGRHGSRYARHIVGDMDRLTLTTICRRSSVGREQARGWNARYCRDWRELIADPDVEVVVAVTVPSLNLEIARQCAVHAKPLLVEKPLAGTVREAAEIVRLMAEANCKLTVAQTLRYNPVIGSLRRQLPQLGTLHSLAVNQRLEPSTLTWHDDPEIAGAGVLFHTAVHVFDALRLITGLRIQQVMAAIRSIHSHRLEDLVTVLFVLENGVAGTLDVSKVGHARTGRYEFVCQNGQLHGDQIHGFTQIVRHNALSAPQPLTAEPTILPLLRDWVDFLETGKNNPVTGEDGLYAVQVCDACLRSAATGIWAEVESALVRRG
ncbi:MAG: Gfo/Idh/MocA family protein [Desulfopila sp.]